VIINNQNTHGQGLRSPSFYHRLLRDIKWQHGDST
jgi:hypothetical protein